MSKAATEIETLRARIRELEDVLSHSNRAITATFRLPPALSQLMGLLLSLPHVNRKIITEQLGVASVAKVAIWRLREELKPFNIEIHSKRSLGWWIEEDDKRRAQELIEATIATNTVPSVEEKPH